MSLRRASSVLIDGRLNGFFAPRVGNLNKPIFKSSNARGLPGKGMMNFRIDRCINRQSNVYTTGKLRILARTAHFRRPCQRLVTLCFYHGSGPGAIVSTCIGGYSPKDEKKLRADPIDPCGVNALGKSFSSLYPIGSCSMIKIGFHKMLFI